MVIQEIFGVNHHMRDMCDRFAAEGYAVCAPALFDRAEKGVELGYTQEDIDKGRAYRMKLNDAQVMLDVEAAAAHLAGKKLGIVGYCFGGTVAWWGATRTVKFAASSCWYGGGIAGTKDERPNCPVQMHFGETGCLDPDDRRARRSAPRSRRWKATSTRAPAMASAVTNEAASASRITSWRNSAPWSSSPNTSAEHEPARCSQGGARCTQTRWNARTATLWPHRSAVSR